MNTPRLHIFKILFALILTIAAQGCGKTDSIVGLTGGDRDTTAGDPDTTSRDHGSMVIKVNGVSMTLRDAYVTDVGGVAWTIKGGIFGDDAAVGIDVFGPIADGTYEVAASATDGGGIVAVGLAKGCYYSYETALSGEVVLESIHNGRATGRFRVTFPELPVNDDYPVTCGAIEVICDGFDLPVVRK